MSRKHPHKKQRIAVIPIVKVKSNLMVCMVTSREQHTWIIPTGKLEKKISCRRVAALEAFEEAGILGNLDKKFKVRLFLKTPSGKHTRKNTVFLLYVTRKLKRWPECKERRRKLVPLEKYIDSLSCPKLKKKLKKI
ncbi:MAG: NUDIX domain-containing protein [Mariprofundus sp.]|nr:NUDIX domain-containing protein [Mariprofundus sp.]